MRRGEKEGGKWEEDWKRRGNGKRSEDDALSLSSGEPLSWGERCRIKHLPTRKYLAVVQSGGEYKVNSCIVPGKCPRLQ